MEHDALKECERLPPAAIFFLSWQAGSAVGSGEADMADYSTVPPPSSGAPGGGGGGGGGVNDAFKDALQRARQVCIVNPRRGMPLPRPAGSLRLSTRPRSSPPSQSLARTRANKARPAIWLRRRSGELPRPSSSSGLRQ